MGLKGESETKRKFDRVHVVLVFAGLCKRKILVAISVFWYEIRAFARERSVSLCLSGFFI